MTNGEYCESYGKSQIFPIRVGNNIIITFTIMEKAVAKLPRTKRKSNVAKA